MAHAGHTLTGPKPNDWISIFVWPTFDRWPSFVRLSRGCFTNGEGIALANVRSFAFVCLSVTWLFLQWRRLRDWGVCTKSRRALTLDTPRSPAPLAVW